MSQHLSTICYIQAKMWPYHCLQVSQGLKKIVQILKIFTQSDRGAKFKLDLLCNSAKGREGSPGYPWDLSRKELPQQDRRVRLQRAPPQ